MMAYGSGRTLVFNWTAKWTFEGSQWTTYFKPLSESCIDEDGNTTEDWPGTNETQVLKVKAYLKEGIPSYWPQSIPRDISDRLKRLHGRPFTWLYGQFFKYLLTPQPYLEETIATQAKRIGFQKPIVGIHVRRTDKIKEARYYNLSEYMDHAESFYLRMEMDHPNVTRRIYLATDDPEVLKEAYEKYPEYQIVSYVADLAQTGALRHRDTNVSLEGIILDIHFLSLSDYVVCTFSSNVCRAVYEIMQSLGPDAANSVRSLDEDYFVYFQHARLQEGIVSHQPQNPEEIDILPGDVITFSQKYFNGFSNGTNQRTKKKGLYPSFKAVDKLDISDFETYPEISGN